MTLQVVSDVWMLNKTIENFWSSRHWFLGFFPSVYRYWVSGAVINSCIQQYSLKIHHLLRHLTADCFFKDNKNLCVRHQQLKSDPKLLPTLTPGQEETERTAPWTTRPSGTFRNTMSNRYTKREDFQWWTRLITATGAAWCLQGWRHCWQGCFYSRTPKSLAMK